MRWSLFGISMNAVLCLFDRVHVILHATHTYTHVRMYVCAIVWRNKRILSLPDIVVCLLKDLCSSTPK